MIILICCIIIFITYVAICSLLSYYFIKRRKEWDTLFSLDAIKKSLCELIFCPEHFIIWLPWIDFEDTQCVLDKKKSDDSRIHIKKILEHINTMMKNIRDISKNNDIDKSKDLSKDISIKKIKWILEGTMKDFESAYDETVTFYNNLSDSYDLLNEKVNQNSTSLNTLEDLVILENNIEICENISSILNVFCNDGYKLMNQIQSGYMSYFIYDLIENIKIYRLKCMIEII